VLSVFLSRMPILYSKGVSEIILLDMLVGITEITQKFFLHSDV